MRLIFFLAFSLLPIFSFAASQTGTNDFIYVGSNAAISACSSAFGQSCSSASDHYYYAKGTRRSDGFVLNANTCAALASTYECYLQRYYFQSSCPSGQSPNSSGMCVIPEPEPEPEPCPAKGTTTNKTYEIKVGMSESYCRNVMIEGCPHSLCDKGATPVALDESGNNCESVPDDPTMLNCFVRPVALEPVERCTGEDCPIGPEEVTESKPVGNPEVSTEINTDPNTGDTKTTEKETTRQVNPDGSSTQTETTTEVKTDSTGTTTTVRTDSKTRNPDGTTTTTTVEEVTGPDGVKKTTISGSSQTGDGLEKAFDSECDPESRDYLQCVGMLEEIGDNQSADLISEIDQAGNDVIDNYETGMADLLSVNESPEEPSAIVNLVNNFIPSSSGCNDFGFTYNGHTFTVPCSRLAPLREWFGWLLSVLSVISIFYIALRPQH